ncbi:DUF4170 domain-containing protein [Caulobacter sp. KR2-114]|uniref:DUF4170 domain-containing protein n=1 Tax=Caulobacter sp. KR2-114 TaxID=3400912 RepID=UPI003C055B3B
MTKERFWVVGGEYACIGFKQLKDGTQQMLGPFETRDEASRAWRRLSAENSSRATARFSIAAEQIALPA